MKKCLIFLSDIFYIIIFQNNLVYQRFLYNYRCLYNLEKFLLRSCCLLFPLRFQFHNLLKTLLNYYNYFQNIHLIFFQFFYSFFLAPL
uniref:Cop protein n=1 Tax=Lactococcus lactis TaxID=1358 RepID=O87263_9LACT|nr:cop protein [Lactococcus lactis]